MLDTRIRIHDDCHPQTFLPAIRFLIKEARRYGFSETAHFLEVAAKSLVEEITWRETNTN